MSKEGKTILKTLTIASVAACSVVPAKAASIAGPHTSFIVLGDSLSDSGNFPQGTWQLASGRAPFFDVPADDPRTVNPEDGGTFSIGPVWAGVLTGDFAAKGEQEEVNLLNTAECGATADTSPPIKDLGEQNCRQHRTLYHLV